MVSIRFRFPSSHRYVLPFSLLMASSNRWRLPGHCRVISVDRWNLVDEHGKIPLDGNCDPEKTMVDLLSDDPTFSRPPFGCES